MAGRLEVERQVGRASSPNRPGWPSPELVAQGLVHHAWVAVWAREIERGARRRPRPRRFLVATSPSSTRARCTTSPVMGRCTSLTSRSAPLERRMKPVRQLAAGLGIERGCGRGRSRSPRRTDALDDLVAADDPTHGRVRDRLVVAGELDLAADRVGHLAVDLCVAVAALLRPGVGLRAVALLPHEPRKPASSTCSPCSAAISRVRSIGKPYVSCRAKASAPPRDGRPGDFALATAVSRIVVPALSVRRNASSSA